MLAKKVTELHYTKPDSRQVEQIEDKIEEEP